MYWGIFFGQPGYLPESWGGARTKTEAVRTIRYLARGLREDGWVVIGNGRNLWYECYPSREARQSDTFLPYLLYADITDEIDDEYLD